MRVLTWNLWWRFGPWEERLPLVVAEVRRLRPDVVCLQEVWSEPATGHSSAAVVAEALGHPTLVHQAGFEVDGVGFGNAVTSRWPAVRREVVALPDAGERDEHRRLVVAVLDAPGGPVTVGCTHLNWRFDHAHVRAAQVATACQALERHRSPLTVLCGDLNAEPDSDELRALTGRAPTPVRGLVFADAWRTAGSGPGDTWDNANPYAAMDREHSRRIDYVLVAWPYPDAWGHPVAAARVGEIPTEGRHPSDHYGVVVDLAPPPTDP